MHHLYYDHLLKILYVYAKKEQIIGIYEFRDNMLEFINNFKDKSLAEAYSFGPKYGINPFKCEIGKMARMTENGLQYISFRMPWDVRYYFND